MDELLKEFLTETNESLDVVDVELVRFEQDPNNAKILDNIFRLVHTIKGTCGFLGLPRLETLAHAAESLMGKFREGMPVTGEAVTLILFTLDRLKEIKCPVFITVGDQDHGTPPDMARAIHANLPGSSLAIIESAAHISNVEQKEVFNKNLMNFLDSVK